MDSPLLHVGLLTDREKIPSDFFPEQEQVKGWRHTGAGEGRQENDQREVSVELERRKPKASNDRN
jgi:hypothetical protein